jgi:hypothetical protein
MFNLQALIRQQSLNTAPQPVNSSVWAAGLRLIAGLQAGDRLPLDLPGVAGATLSPVGTLAENDLVLVQLSDQGGETMGPSIYRVTAAADDIVTLTPSAIPTALSPSDVQPLLVSEALSAYRLDANALTFLMNLQDRGNPLFQQLTAEPSAKRGSADSGSGSGDIASAPNPAKKSKSQASRKSRTSSSAAEQAHSSDEDEPHEGPRTSTVVAPDPSDSDEAVSYTHLRAHETG